MREREKFIGSNSKRTQTKNSTFELLENVKFDEIL